MNEIEKRATTHSEEENNLLFFSIEDIKYRSYKIGATEQKAIDIEKACEAHCKLCDKYARCEHTAWGYENVKCNEREIIRKAMEELP